jgi:hypothetical protein
MFGLFIAILSTGLLDGMNPEAEIDEAHDNRPEGFEHRAFLLCAQPLIFKKMFVPRDIEGHDRTPIGTARIMRIAVLSGVAGVRHREILSLSAGLFGLSSFLLRRTK